MSIMGLNGGLVMAMRGSECVAIGSDLRLGNQRLTVSTDYEKVFKMGDLLYVGLCGLSTDAQTIAERMLFRKNLYEFRENRAISPKVFAKMLSNLLYEKRFGTFFSEPVVAGLDPKTYESYIGSMDLIGCLSDPEDFVAVGTGDSSVAGLAETYWEPNMDQDALFEATAQTLLGALERDASSGWGAVVYLVTKEGVVARTLKARLD